MEEMTQTVRDLLAEVLRTALVEAQAAGALPAFPVPEQIPVEVSKHEGHGDYASPLCLTLARAARRAPLQIAEALLPFVPPCAAVAKLEAVAPGYLNFTLDPVWLAQQVARVIAAGPTWGNVDVGHGARVQVEFVSANPTGPLTIGSARNAVIGDALASLLAAAGYQVEREYYVNDAGSKSRVFGESIYARYATLFGVEYPFPEKGYPGAYVTELARELAQEAGRRYLELEPREAIRQITDWGVERVLGWIRADMERMRVHFDSWFHERWFYERGMFEPILERLRAGGYLVEYDDAVWFRHPSLEKDAVLIRSPRVVAEPDDRPTYLASDAVYVWDKLVTRGFDKAIYVWGADHHGDVPRVKAAAQALGLDPERVVIILYQLVTLYRGGQEVRMSKSSGEFVTLRELLDEVGPDAVRFMLLTRTADVKFDFDLDLAVEQSDRNPVYYVQYAHTRIAGVLRHAAEQGLTPDPAADLNLLTHPSELALIRKMLELPEVIAMAARALAPHHLTSYAMELAALFHAFYRDCRIVMMEPEARALAQARLQLALAARITLARVLTLMGMDTPERM